MTDYRVYIIGDDDHIMGRIDIDCADDNAAIESAKQYIDGHDIELWQRDHRIARFDMRPEGKLLLDRRRPVRSAKLRSAT
jgi:hypothetical protein